MCGVIAYQPYKPDCKAESAFELLFNESAIRGLHAFGIAQQDYVIRPCEISGIVFDKNYPAIAHARYSTSGSWKISGNNQPLVVGGYSLVFNGVIHMGTKNEMEQEFSVKLITENDGEIFLQCLEKGESAEKFINRISGSFAGCWFDHGVLYAGRNARRPLWKCDAYGADWYASTKDIFHRARFPEPTEVAIGVERA